MANEQTPSVAEKLTWSVTGMDCAACAAKVRGAVERLPGVADVDVAIMSERMSLLLTPGTTSVEKISTVVSGLGYKAELRAGKLSKSPMAANSIHGEHKHDHDHDHDLDHDHKDGGKQAASIAPVASSAASASESDPGHGSAGHAHGTSAEDQGKSWYQTSKGKLVVFTALLLGVAWALKLIVSDEVGKWAFVAACLIGVAPVAKRAFAALMVRQPFTIEMLMTIAAVGALFINAAEEAALVVFLFAVGEVLEGVAADRARASIRALANLVPKTALVEEEGSTRQVDAASLDIGQIILARPGDRIAADGDIVEGISGVDESPVTGESVPRTKGPGEPVFAGSINAEAALRIKVTKTAENNTISRIIALVEEAESARAPTERFIDRFSRIYMPAIVLIALLVAFVPPLGFGGEWATWVYRALALLLIGCPCALVISVPASIASALSTGAKRGLLMKGGAVIEAAAKTTVVAFDKTGTLTSGRPSVTDIIAIAAKEPEILRIAAGIESGSSHPLAEAILKKAEQDGVVPAGATGSKAIIGKGVEATVEGQQTWVASPNYATSLGALDEPAMQRAQDLEAQGKTVVVLFRVRSALGLIAMRDEAREDAIEAIRQLTALNVRSVMLTGDNPRTAAAIAEQMGMDYKAELMPEDKVTAIKDLALGGGAMMIGDGINDAPALAQASVGIAMGSGTDVALETADAAILRNRVTDVAAIIRLARGAMSNIRQNVTIALGLKAVFLVTSILGLTGLWIAILADTGATVLVTLNALRLLRFNPEKEG
jgi:Cd2+/Zn2+-exporting ATPase